MNNETREFGNAAAPDDLGALARRAMWSQAMPNQDQSGYYMGANSLHSFLDDIRDTQSLDRAMQTIRSDVNDANVARCYLDLAVGVKGMMPHLQEDVAEQAKSACNEILKAIKQKNPPVYEEYAGKLDDAGLEKPPALKHDQ